MLDPQPKPNTSSPNEGVNFSNWDNLQPDQQDLLSSFFGSRSASIDYTSLQSQADGEVATFLAVTHALSLLRLAPNTDDEMDGMGLIKGIKEVRTDRLIVYLDLEMINKWKKDGINYSLPDVKNKTELGRLKFFNHSTLSAGLHCGYDLQWYTKASKGGHLHWNVRLSDGLADVHLDGYASWIDGFIPNPIHLTYQNSDVRYWYNKYFKKYGNPGFVIRKRPS